MDESRRRFLKGAGATALGLGCGMPILDAAANTLVADQEHGAPATRQWAMVVDIAKCRDERVRRTCVTACHREHAVPSIPASEDEVKWIWTEHFENTFPDEVHAGMSEEMLQQPVLVLCNHCSSPPCVRVCPTGATWKRDSDGIVMMDMHRCIGCRYCMAACPYGSRSFNWRDPRPFIEMGEDGQPLTDFPTRTKGVVEKCNFCAERLRDGREPACVEAVNSIEGGQGALTFGDLSDASSDVRRILRERYTIARRVGLGTGPNVFYIV
jgi:Fe-S-cluster-containing dehydrogenase component